MKLKSLLILAAALGLAASLNAAEKLVTGPKGGRLLETAAQKTEFYVNAERRVEINLYDAALKPIAPGAQVVVLTAEPKSGRQQMEFEKTATGFISTSKLPAGEPYRVVVQVRESAGAKPRNFRIEFNLSTCAECDHAEYACTCGH